MVSAAEKGTGVESGRACVEKVPRSSVVPWALGSSAEEVYPLVRAWETGRKPFPDGKQPTFWGVASSHTPLHVGKGSTCRSTAQSATIVLICFRGKNMVIACRFVVLRDRCGPSVVDVSLLVGTDVFRRRTQA